MLQQSHVQNDVPGHVQMEMDLVAPLPSYEEATQGLSETRMVTEDRFGEGAPPPVPPRTESHGAMEVDAVIIPDQLQDHSDADSDEVYSIAC